MRLPFSGKRRHFMKAWHHEWSIMVTMGTQDGYLALRQGPSSTTWLTARHEAPGLGRGSFSPVQFQGTACWVERTLPGRKHEVCLPTSEMFPGSVPTSLITGAKGKGTRRSGIQFPVRWTVGLWRIITAPPVPLRFGRNSHPRKIYACNSEHRKWRRYCSMLVDVLKDAGNHMKCVCLKDGEEEDIQGCFLTLAYTGV